MRKKSKMYAKGGMAKKKTKAYAKGGKVGLFGDVKVKTKSCIK